MKVVPQLLYQHKNVRKIMVDGLSCIVHKTMDTIDLNTDHYVSSHVLSVVLKGKLNIETYYEEERFSVGQNQLVFIPKGRYMISDVLPENDEFEAVFYFFEEKIIHEFLAGIKSIDTPVSNPSLLLDYSENIRIFTESILKVYTENANKEVTKLKLLELLYLIYNSLQQDHLIQILLSINEKKKRNLEELMLENFDKPLSVEDYAFLAGRSISSFNRDFQRKFEMPPKKWIIKKRLEKAVELLTSTDLNIEQISVEAGYENVSYFIALFGKQFGISPKQFLIKKRTDKLLN
ncbi:helix-turn-helix domain-containing protein [Flavobacterium limi]|uniref:AraC family transcriptional regulator n=1 Tax=Flavobacterium limi TaxID=2045105 RepID=A0ABQ1UBX8_9FLAO|nr:AraC family transcriptional regulator [Flavobacterium limi]GGF13338.1 AraC family transcriptional regulator [Flavobacterium limi]